MQVVTLCMEQSQREALIPYCTFTPLTYDIGDLRDLFLAASGALDSLSSWPTPICLHVPSKPCISLEISVSTHLVSLVFCFCFLRQCLALVAQAGFDL